MTERARFTWSQGDFARAGAEQVIVGELLCRAIDIHPGERVLDVAAGSGNAALAAARRGAKVTATDFVPHLLETAARRAGAEGLELETQEADAQALPFPDGTFDVVLSTFGVMFAPDQAGAAAELLRVCRPGGRIGLTAWTPASVMAATQAIAAKYAPRQARRPQPDGVGHRGPGPRAPRRRRDRPASEVLTTDLCGLDPAARVEFNRAYVGPTKVLFDRLAPDAQESLATELARCFQHFNRAADGTLVAPAGYLQVLATRAAG